MGCGNTKIQEPIALSQLRDQRVDRFNQYIQVLDEFLCKYYDYDGFNYTSGIKKIFIRFSNWFIYSSKDQIKVDADIVEKKLNELSDN